MLPGPSQDAKMKYLKKMLSILEMEQQNQLNRKGMLDDK